MKKIERTARQLYVCPRTVVLEVEAEGSFLAGSPLVRPGGGGVAPHQGDVKVIDPTEEDGGEDDNLEG